MTGLLAFTSGCRASYPDADLPEAPALPPKVSLEEARGFTLWATRSILSGDGSAELEGARTNLRRLAVE